MAAFVILAISMTFHTIYCVGWNGVRMVRYCLQLYMLKEAQIIGVFFLLTGQILALWSLQFRLYDVSAFLLSLKLNSRQTSKYTLAYKRAILYAKGFAFLSSVVRFTQASDTYHSQTDDTTFSVTLLKPPCPQFADMEEAAVDWWGYHSAHSALIFFLLACSFSEYLHAAYLIG